MNIGFVDLQDDKEIESSIYHENMSKEYVIVKINDITNYDRFYIVGQYNTSIIFQDKNNRYAVSLTILNKCIVNVLSSMVENIYGMIIQKIINKEDVDENINGNKICKLLNISYKNNTSEFIDLFKHMKNIEKIYLDTNDNDRMLSILNNLKYTKIHTVSLLNSFHRNFENILCLPYLKYLSISLYESSVSNLVEVLRNYNGIIKILEITYITKLDYEYLRLKLTPIINCKNIIEKIIIIGIDAEKQLVVGNNSFPRKCFTKFDVEKLNDCMFEFVL